MMGAVQRGLIPLYMLMVKIGWNGELKAVIGPSLVCGFGVFMIRQYAVQAISDELVEAARVDGCSPFRIYLSVVLPAWRPAAAVLALLTFMQTWNDFLWPYAVLDANTPTVQLSLSLLATAYYTDYAQVFAATALSTVPLLVVFVVFGRQIIGGIMEGAVKSCLTRRPPLTSKTSPPWVSRRTSCSGRRPRRTRSRAVSERTGGVPRSGTPSRTRRAGCSAVTTGTWRSTTTTGTGTT